jgi:hypothetical protein
LGAGADGFGAGAAGFGAGDDSAFYGAGLGTAARGASFIGIFAAA